MAKLTLSVDENIVSHARRYAKQQGVSISGIVEAYLAAVATPSHTSRPNAPILHSLRGSLKRADIEKYRSHLAAKYR